MTWNAREQAEEQFEANTKFLAATGEDKPAFPKKAMDALEDPTKTEGRKLLAVVVKTQLRKFKTDTPAHSRTKHRERTPREGKIKRGQANGRQVQSLVADQSCA